MTAFADDSQGGSAGLDGGYTTAQATEAPVISDVSVDVPSRTVTITGSSFGAVQGTGTAYLCPDCSTQGANNSTVVSWSDNRIQLALSDDPYGIVVVIVVTDGGSARFDKFVSEGPDVYEERPDALPVNGLSSNYTGALGSSGILKGWGKYLYYLSEAPVSEGSSNFAFHTFQRWRIGSGEWEQLPSLPEWLTYCSGAVWEGSLLVTGVVYDPAVGAATTEQRIYMYNFELGDWVLLDSDDVPLGAGIVNLNGFLRLVGGADSNWNFKTGVYEYDTGSGIGSLVGALDVAAFCPQLAVHDGQIFVYSYGDTIDQYNGAGGPRHLQVVLGDETVALNGVFPEFAQASLPSDAMPARSEQFGSISAAIEGLMLVGPEAADSATDTYILDWNWESSTFLPYYKRASDAALFGTATCMHDDLLYAVAWSAVEDSHEVFRATELMAPAVQSGNYSVWRQGSGANLPIVFTPDYSRYHDRVFVDGVELYGDTEYYASMGDDGYTTIDLTSGFLSTLSLGEHDMTVEFDGYEAGPGAEVIAHFIIEGAAAPMATSGAATGQGYGKPAALAMTGDTLLAVPFVFLGFGALAVGAYLVRRKVRSI